MFQNTSMLFSCYLFIYLYIYLFNYLFIYLFIYIFIYVFICIFIFIFFNCFFFRAEQMTREVWDYVFFKDAPFPNTDIPTDNLQ